MGGETVSPVGVALRAVAFSTLCGPMGGETVSAEISYAGSSDLSVPSAGLWVVKQALSVRRENIPPDFQYPLRAYGW